MNDLELPIQHSLLTIKSNSSMSPTIKIAVLGVTGETGASITQGLIDCTEISLEITALVREESIKKPLLLAYAEKGVKIVVVDIDGPISTLTAALDGIDVVISAVGPNALLSQIHVADACKAAGVGRFVPCNFATVAPPTGILMLRDIVSFLVLKYYEVTLIFFIFRKSKSSTTLK